MSKAKFKVGDKVKDLVEGGNHRVSKVEFDDEDSKWYYSYGVLGWFWVPEDDLELVNENEKD